MVTVIGLVERRAKRFFVLGVMNMLYTQVTGHPPVGRSIQFEVIDSSILEALEARKWVFFGHHKQMKPAERAARYYRPYPGIRRSS
jgi:hypothetical protein